MSTKQQGGKRQTPAETPAETIAQAQAVLAARTPKNGRNLTAAQRTAAQTLFLSVFAQYGNATLACKAAGVTRQAYYGWLETDADFVTRHADAEADACNVLYQEAYRRGVQGVEKVVVSMGKVVMVGGKPLTEREYSDSLLKDLLRARHPLFRERSQVDITSGGKPLHDLMADVAQTVAAIMQQDTQDIQERRQQVVDEHPYPDI